MDGSSMRRAAAALLAFLMCVGVPASGATDVPSSKAGVEAFDWAFRFASAIDADPKDKSLAQASVAITRAMAGDLDAAIALADDVTGWRQGTVYADLAVMAAKEGRVDEARRLVARAEEVRASIEGWQNGRIRSHVAHAGALLGDVERSKDVAGELAKIDIQYVGKSVANVASGDALRGNFDRAMEALGDLDGNEDYEVAWWRTYGYLEIGGLEGLTGEQRRTALDRAVASAGTIPGWKRSEALILISDALVEFGDVDAAREALASAEEALADLEPTAAVHGPLLCDLARAWGRAGVPDRALPLIDRARQGIGRAMTIDRPQIYAEIGSAWLVLGDDAKAHEYYHSALRQAQKLVNARPRALAVVAICSSMGRFGATLDDLERSYLDALLAGLREPW